MEKTNVEWGFTTKTNPLYDYREIPQPKVLCVIPARGGSKGFPGKNIAMLAGKPLLAHTIEHALRSQNIYWTVVSTDDDDIADVAVDWGARVVMRPDSISGDHVQSEKAVEHVLANTNLRPDIVVMLQCTSPIRKPRHIDEAIQLVIDGPWDSVISGVWAHKFIWRFDGENAYPLNYDFRSRPMRQHRPKEFLENGSIYVFRTDVLERYGSRCGDKRYMYEMPRWCEVEIDQVDDLDLCEWILGREP